MRSIITQKLKEGYEFKAFRYIEQGWQNYTANWSQYTLATLLFSFLSSAISILPLGGVLVALLLSPLFEAGCFIVANLRYEGKNTTFQNFLDGKEQLGGLVLAAFFYILIAIGVVFLLAFSLSIPLAVLIKTYGFSNGFLASGALLPSIGLGLAGLLIGLAFMVCYIYAYQYVIFAGMEGGEAIGTSRRMVMQQFNATFVFMLLFTLAGAIYSGSILFAFGIFEPLIKVMEAAISQDVDVLREIQEETSYLPQIAASILASFFTPFFYCVRQAAFRDIHDMERKTPIDNTIDHFII
jgi:MFS family permease